MHLGGKKRVSKKVGKLRRGQLISTFACGAIVDLPQESVVIAGTDFWRHQDRDEYKIHENNLQQLLGIDYFVEPPGSTENYINQYGVPAFRFPNWMYCPKCKRLAHEKKFNFVGSPRCEKCKKRLVPSRFVIACEHGHMDDFPYEWWVHDGSICDRPELFITMSELSSGLDSIIIACKTCNKSRSMAGSFVKDSLKGFRCTTRRPWLKDKDPSGCEKRMRTVQRGATNLHFSINISALSIPPWSSRVQLEIENLWGKLRPLMDDRSVFISVVQAWGLPQKCGHTAEEIWVLAEKKYKGEDAAHCGSWKELLESEYRAFVEGCDDEKGEFKTRDEEIAPVLSDYVDQVALALRLREILALRGFRRINPEYDVDDDRTFNRISKDLMKWLPAVEMKGEGIFIRLKDSAIRTWENREDVRQRYKRLENAKNYMRIKGPAISPRYVLLHTISHLLIRELILQCGYSSASIKERIYSTFSDVENSIDMAGILLYTSSNDSEGSLGGLVRMGETKRFENVFRQMLETGSWCSADPLCIQSKGQGIDALNYAACHSCLLLPETSCEVRNCYLDRASVVGTLDQHVPGYFSQILRQGVNKL